MKFVQVEHSTHAGGPWWLRLFLKDSDSSVFCLYSSGNFLLPFQVIVCPGRIQISSILGTLPGLWRLPLRPVMGLLTMATSLANQCWPVRLRGLGENGYLVPEVEWAV